MRQVNRKMINRFLSIAGIVFIMMPTNLFFTTQKTTNEDEKIKLAIERGVDFLQTVQRNDGAICDTSNRLFDVWETILAATAICKVHPDTNAAVLNKALTFLQHNQNSEGLICHNQKCKKAYCLETTAVYFDLLKLIGRNENVKTALGTIKSLQKKTGEWDIGNPDVLDTKDFPSVTAFVLNLLQDAASKPVYKKQAINWLLSKQTKQGHWGVAWEYYGCPAYALWPVMKVLQQQNTSECNAAKDRALAYIISTQQANGSWFYRDELLHKQTSAELQTALMLAALQQAGAKNKEVLLKGVNFLLAKQQTKGNWDGGYFPIPDKRYSKQEYIFATAIAVDVLNNYLHNQ